MKGSSRNGRGGDFPLPGTSSELQLPPCKVVPFPLFELLGIVVDLLHELVSGDTGKGVDIQFKDAKAHVPQVIKLAHFFLAEGLAEVTAEKSGFSTTEEKVGWLAIGSASGVDKAPQLRSVPGVIEDEVAGN